MKLHLPNLLRKAVLACMASFVVLHSTVASATLTQVATMADLVATGTLGTGVTNTSGARYTSYSFTGEGAITGITSTAVLNAITSTSTTNYVTIAAWVNPADNDGVQSIFGYGAQNNGFKFAVNGSGLQYTAKGVADTTAQGTNVTAGSWSLVAITFCLDDVGNDRYLIGTADGGYWSNQNMKNVSEPAAGDKTFAIGSGNSGNLREGYSGEIQNLTIFTSDGLVTNADLVEVMGSIAPSDVYEPDISDLPQQVYTGATNNNIDLSTYADGHQLVFALETTGDDNWFKGNGAQVVNSDVHIGSLDGSRTTGLAMTNGNSDNHQIFTGKVTGRGIIHKSSGGSGSAISFTGDTTGFKGNIYLNPSATFTLTFGTVVIGTGDSAVTYTATPGASSAESGIIGNGSISINGAGKANLVFNYDAGATPIYITNNFTFDSGTTANRVQLNGAADYVIAGEVDVAYLNRFQANTTGKVTFEKATANVTGSETVATTAALSRANDTLYKKGSGTYKLAHDVEFANIVVKQGTLLWQSGADDRGTAAINAKKLTIGKGATFKISQTVNKNTGIDVVLEGGTLFSFDQGGDNPFVGFGVLDVQADSVISYQYGSTLKFAGLTGSGNLSITKEGTSVEPHYTDLGNINDYTGTISISDVNHQSLTIGTVTLSEGKSLALGADVTSTNFAKYGAGSLTLNGNLTINGRFDAFYEGTITQAEGKSISVANNSTLVCKENGTGSRLTLAALPDNLLLDLKGVSETAARAGIDLGLAYSADLASKLQFSGAGASKTFADYFSVTNDGGKAKLTYTGGAAEASEWDANWGVHAMMSAPVGLAATSVADDEYALHNTGDSLNYVAINATGGGDNVVIYGGRSDNGNTYVNNEEVWIKASSGKFLGIVGGSRASNWAYRSASWALNADTHIVVDGAEVGHVIGGFRQECNSPVLTGDTYISIKSGNITGNITGSNLMSDGDSYSSTHKGNSHVYIYTPLNNTTNAAYLQGGSEGAMDIITGGALGAYNNGQNYRVARYTMVGDTDVVVDLNSYSGSETGFKKAIYGGSHIVRPGSFEYGNVCSVVMDGNTNVTITGAGSITFAGDIVGGSHIQGGAASISGTSSVSIDGGTYAGMVVGGSIVEDKSTTTVGGTSVKLSGGTYQQSVIGGTYAKAGAATASVGDVKVAVSGAGTSTGTIYGGSYIGGTDETAITASVGNINIDMTGGTVAKLVGGSYVERNAAGSTVKQGDVTLNLEGGSITGNVYAAGSQQGSTTISTGNVAVKLGSALAMTSGTISAGLEPSATAPSPIAAATTTSRTLELVGSQDRSGVTIDQFDTIKVTTADTTAKVGSITGATGLTKTGAGALQMGGSTLESLTVSEGTVALTGDNTLGSISVAANAGLDLSGATTLGADITLANNTSLVGGAADMGGKALTLGTGLNITGTEVDGVITLMSNVGSITGITFDAAGKAAADSILASINGVQDIAGWFLAKKDNTLTLLNPALMVQNVEWSQANSYWQNGQEFDDAGTLYQSDKKYNVLFGELTGTSSTAPEFVQVNGAVVADSMVVDGGEGQVYVFKTDDGTGSGIAAVTNGIEILSGTAVFEDGTLAMTEDTTLTVAGSTLVLHDGAVVNQSAVDIILGNAGTLSWAAGNTTDYSLNGGLSIAEGATEVTLDMGTNVVQLNGEIQGTVSGVTLKVVGNGTLEARPGVLGTSKVVVNGVNLSLASDVEYAASFANTADEGMSIAASTGKETTLSGDNTGFNGEVRIGNGTTLVLKGSKALGADMALVNADTASVGSVAFASPDGDTTAEFTLTTDDVYTGTTTVRNGATLNWGEATVARSGGIVLDDGSTLKLTCAVANAISDGRTTDGLERGKVIISGGTAADPIEWDNTDKTYSGLTTIADNSVVEANAPLTDGNNGAIDRVHLETATSVLKMTNAAWNGTWTAGHNVYGAGTVLLDSAGNTFQNSLIYGLVEPDGDNKDNTLANVTIASGSTLVLQGMSTDDHLNRFNNITTITVESGAALKIDGGKFDGATNTWKIAGNGISDGGVLIIKGETYNKVGSTVLLEGNSLITGGNFNQWSGTIDGQSSHNLTYTMDSGAQLDIQEGGKVRNIATLEIDTSGSGNWGNTFFNAGSLLENITTLADIDANNVQLNGTMKNIASLDVVATDDIVMNGTATGMGSVALSAATTISQNSDGSITGVSKDTSTLSLTATTSATLYGSISDFKTVSIDAPASTTKDGDNNVGNFGTNKGTLSNIGTLEVKSGVLKVGNDALTNINKIEVADGAKMLFAGVSMTPGVTEIDLKDGAVLSYRSKDSGNVLKLGTVTATNTDDTKYATIQNDVWNHGIIDIATLNGSGELHLKSYGDAAAAGAVIVRDGDFNGTVQVRQANKGSKRNFVFATQDTDVLAGAVINMGQVASASQSDEVKKGNVGFVIGGAADNTVKVQGISSDILATVNDNTSVLSTGDNNVTVEASTLAELREHSWLISGGNTLFADAQSVKNTVADYADSTMRVLEIGAAATDSYEFVGIVGSALTVKMNGTGTQKFSGKLSDATKYEALAGTLAISGKGQTGSHTFTATGGTLDMGGYAADTNATLDDTIVAAGGTVKDLTLGAGMTLEQSKTEQGQSITSQLAGALTLAGGKMAFDLTKTTANGATTYGVGTLYTSAASTSLVVDTTVDRTADGYTDLVFRTDDLLPYIDATQGTEITGQEGRYYSLITGLTSVSDQNGAALTDLSTLKTNFSNDGRAQHSIVVMEQKDTAGAGTGKFDLMLKVIGAPAILAWTGKNGTLTPDDATAGTPAMLTGTWDTKGADNWQIQGGTTATDDMFYSDDSVVFDQVTGDADNDPNTPDVAINQVVNVAADGVKIGTMQVRGGTYTFEGGAISSAEGMGDITISGGNATFNNSITTDGDLTVTGGNVVLAAANSYTGESTFTGGTVTVGNAAALSTTKTTVGLPNQLGTLILNITDATANTISNEISHRYGFIYAQESATLQNLNLSETGSDKSLNAAEGKTLTATLTSDKIEGTLRVNNKQTDATGTVTLTTGENLTSIGGIVVERGTFNATFNGTVSNGGAVTYSHASTGSMTFNGTAALGTITLGNAAVTMDFKENATVGAINMNADADKAGYDAEHPENHKLTATFEKAATVGAITGNRGSIDITVKGAATQTGALASGSCITKVDFQGGVSGGQSVTVNGSTTTLSFGAESTVGNILVQNAAELSLGVSQGKTASVLNAGTVTLASSSDADLTVTGGLTLKSANIVSGSTAGTVKLVGSTLDYSGSNLGANMIVNGDSTLKSTATNGTTVTTGKTITLTGTGTTNLVGTWTLDSATLVQQDATAGLKVNGSSTLKMGSDMQLSALVVDSAATVRSTADGTARTLTLTGSSSVHGTTTEDITVKVTGGVNWINEGADAQGDVIVDAALTDITNLNIQNDWKNNSSNHTTLKSLTVKSGRVTVDQYGTNSQLQLGSGVVNLEGASAVLNLGGKSGVDNSTPRILTKADGTALADINIKEGRLENAGNWQGHVDIVDTVQVDDVVTHNYLEYDLGGITGNATVNIGSLNANAITGEYSRLTNVGSLKLVGENSITLIDAMKTGDSLFGITGAETDPTKKVTLADGEADSLHIDINSVLESLLGATEGTPKVTEFNLGGNLSELAGKANVIFDTALNLYNLAATFGTDGKLTLTQNVPMEEGSYYDATAKQGDSTAWVGNGAEELYDSAEGYSAILVNTDTVIDLTGTGVSAAGQADNAGMGMVLNNVNGTADLSIAGNGDDLVTISNTVKNIKLSGDVSVADTDVQILHTKEAHVADDGSVLTVDTLSTDADSELKLVAGKLALAEDGSALLGGVTVADGGHAQLILNGDTTLGGTITTANAAEMLAATGVQWDIDLSNAADVENVVLGAGKTATLADGAVVESGVGMKGAEGSTLKLAEGATATISQAASLTGMALEVAEGTELKVDAAYKGGDLSFTDATIAGKLSSMTSDATVSAEAGINLSATEGKTSTISGDLSGYTGWLALKGAGSYKMTTDAAGADLYVEGSTTTIEAGQDGVISLRSLLLTDNGTLNLDMASDRNVSNKKLNTTEGVTLADGTMNLTANLSKVSEGGVVFTGGKVTVEEGATINLTVNRVSDAVAEDLLSNGASSITLADVAEGDANVTVINEDQRMSKYFHNAVVKVVDGKLVLTGDVVDGETADYHKQLAETENGKAGASMLDEAYGSSMKEINAAESDVKSMLTYMEDLIAAGNTAGMDEALAAVAGSSTAVLGMAAAGDVERQLKAIRNRTTTMGVDQSVLHEELPYLNAWINAEGDHREMNDDGTLGGYKLNSWGGTVGFDADLTPTFTAGMALTAMYGDLDATGADKATGNMDSYYVSAFARYCGSAWTHTFVGTIGKSDITLDRTVNYGGGSYKTEGETNAMSFGVMYEVGRVFALNEDATTCLQPIFNVTWRHTTVDAYNEKSKGDAALSVDEQTVDTVTFGLGARLQTVVGESIYNRTSILECRVLAKADTGDSSSATSTALQAYNEAKQDVESAEKGNFGVEAGMGLTIPVGQENASIFMDASVELRADYTNVNGTVGYRVNF